MEGRLSFPLFYSVFSLLNGTFRPSHFYEEKCIGAPNQNDLFVGIDFLQFDQTAVLAPIDRQGTDQDNAETAFIGSSSSGFAFFPFLKTVCSLLDLWLPSSGVVTFTPTSALSLAFPPICALSFPRFFFY